MLSREPIVTASDRGAAGRATYQSGRIENVGGLPLQLDVAPIGILNRTLDPTILALCVSGIGEQRVRGDPAKDYSYSLPRA
jgi:hypothetical protein